MAIPSGARLNSENGNPYLDCPFVLGTTAPSNLNLLWIDSGNDYILKFYNTALSTPAWVPVGAVWK